MKTIIALLWTAFPLAAAPSVHWHGNYLEDGKINAHLDLKEPRPVENGVFYAFQDITPKHSQYLRSAPSAVFWGAVRLVNQSTSGGMEGAMNQIRRQGGKESASFLMISTSPGLVDYGHQQAAGIIVWPKESFQNASEEAVALGDFSRFRVKVGRSGSQRLIRFAVRSEGEWYLSEACTEGKDGELALTLEQPATAKWEKWHCPTDAEDLEPAPDSFTTDGATLSTIDAVGIYFDSTYQFTTRASVSITEFLAQ